MFNRVLSKHRTGTMPSRVFAVILEKPNPGFMERLKKHYGDNTLMLSEAAALVRDDLALTEDIAVRTGVKGGDEPVGGIVFKISRSYAGFTDRSVWEWLAFAQNEDQEGRS